MPSGRMAHLFVIFSQTNFPIKFLTLIFLKLDFTFKEALNEVLKTSSLVFHFLILWLPAKR